MLTTPSNDPTAPNGDSDLELEIKDRLKIVNDFYKDWDEEAKEDYKFALGDQWTEEERAKLKEAGRPALTFNRIRPLINIVSGYQRENSARIKINPEGGEDQVFSEVMDRGIKFVDKTSHLTYKMGYWFDDGCYCGKGFLEGILNYDNDPIRGELEFKQLSPYQVKVDPECLEYDMNAGAGYLFKSVRLSKTKLKELYPSKKDLITGFITDNDDSVENGAGAMRSETENDDYGSRPQTQSQQTVTNGGGDGSGGQKDTKFTVKEYWRQKLVERFYVINLADSEPKRFDDKKSAEEFAAKQNFGEVINRKMKEMWVAAYCCGYLLQDMKSPFEPWYSGFPFFRFLADWAPNAEKEILRTQGLTRPLKDPQREKNKSKSQYLHILNTQANSGWIGDEDALTPSGWADLEKMGSKPGITVKKKKGFELREILPKGPNNGHLAREKDADAEFTQISNINPDLLGFQDGTTSGKAIGMRIKQAVLALVRLFSNYRYSKEIVGNFILAMMPAVFDAKKMMKVLGSDFMAKSLDPQKYPQGMTEGIVDAYLQMVKDDKYDVVVTEADQNSTIRYEIFQELSDLLKAGAQIPVELLIDYMDLPNAEEVKQKIAQYQQAQAAATAQPAPAK